MSAPIIGYEEKFLHEIKDIFFESSSKKIFKDEREKEKFFYKYLGYYIDHFPDWIFLYFDSKVRGYVVASPTDPDAKLLNLQPHLGLFKDHFKSFPAHLHINCHIDSRGQGIGAQLIDWVLNQLKFHGIKGIHVITSPDAISRSFYRKLNFHFEVVEIFHHTPLLFMGKNF
jgi:hypothetical protein